MLKKNGEILEMRTSTMREQVFENLTLALSDTHRAKYFLVYTISMFIGALVWGVLCLSLNHTEASIIPFSYAVMTIFNLYIVGASEESVIPFHLQVFASILLPFLFQHMLGGVYSSGIVMIWSLLALVTALSFMKIKPMIFWFGFYMVLLCSALMVEYMSIAEGADISLGLTGLNLVMVSLVLFISALFFGKTEILQKREQRVVTKNVATRNERLRKDFEVADFFQKEIVGGRELKKAPPNCKTFSLIHTETRVLGDLLWEGKALDTYVVVLLENPASGLSGALQSLHFKSIIESAVLEKGIVEPSEIVKHLDSSLGNSLRKDKKKLFNDLHVSVMTNENDSRKVKFSSTGTSLFIQRNGRLLEFEPDTKFKLGLNFGRIKNEPDTHKIDLNAADVMILQNGNSMNLFRSWVDEKKGDLAIEKDLNSLKKSLADMYSSVINGQDSIDDLLLSAIEFK